MPHEVVAIIFPQGSRSARAFHGGAPPKCTGKLVLAGGFCYAFQAASCRMTYRIQGLGAEAEPSQVRAMSPRVPFQSLPVGGEA